jgi:hypothetical protein
VRFCLLIECLESALLDVDLGPRTSNTSAEDHGSDDVHNSLQSYDSGRSSTVTSASFVPDWMLGTHVWRTEDAMAHFDLPQQYRAYYSDVVNYCMCFSAAISHSLFILSCISVPLFPTHKLINVQDLTVIVPVWITYDEKGPSNFVDNHIKACMGSRLLLEVLAAFTFTHQDRLHKKAVSYKARKHSTEAVRLVNEKLRSGVVEDSLILAVGTLCITAATSAADAVRTSGPLSSKLKHI